MYKYYCPFCEKHYHLNQKAIKQDLYCDLCGDYLLKVPLINITRLIAILIAAAFFAPLFFMIYEVFNDFKNQVPKQQIITLNKIK